MPSLLQESSGAAHGSAAAATTTTTTADGGVKGAVHIGEIYWKQDGPCGWVLGQITAFHQEEQRARFTFIDEASGETIPDDEQAPLELDTRQVPLYPANPLFR